MTFLDTLRELDKAATPGPWCYETDEPGDGVYAIGTYKDQSGKPVAGPVDFTDDNVAVHGIAVRVPSYDHNDADFPLIVALRNAAPALAAVIEAAQHAVAVCGLEGSLDKLDTALAALDKGAK